METKEKRTSESKHPSSCIKSGKIDLEGYVEDMVQRSLRGFSLHEARS